MSVIDSRARAAFCIALVTVLAALQLTSCQASATQPAAEGEPSPTDGMPRVDELQPTGDPALRPDSCSPLTPHPVGQSIADKFEVSYGDVMAWFCDGHSFEDILLALQTSEIADIDPGALLDRYSQIGWERLWQELELMPVGESEQATIP